MSRNSILMGVFFLLIGFLAITTSIVIWTLSGSVYQSVVLLGISIPVAALIAGAVGGLFSGIAFFLGGYIVGKEKYGKGYGVAEYAGRKRLTEELDQLEEKLKIKHRNNLELAMERAKAQILIGMIRKLTPMVYEGLELVPGAYSNDPHKPFYAVRLGHGQDSRAQFQIEVAYRGGQSQSLTMPMDNITIQPVGNGTLESHWELLSLSLISPDFKPQSNTDCRQIQRLTNLLIGVVVDHCSPAALLSEMMPGQKLAIAMEERFLGQPPDLEKLNRQEVNLRLLERENSESAGPDAGDCQGFSPDAVQSSSSEEASQSDDGVASE